MRFLFKTLILASILFLIAISLLYFNQEKLVFFPKKLDPNYVFEFPSSFEEGYLTLSNNDRVNYLVFDAQDSKGNILYFHGNAGSLQDWGHVAANLSSQTNWTVWIVDYPGYGKSDGGIPKNEEILIEVAKKFLVRADRASPNTPVVAYGRSIGSGVAATLAEDPRISGLILETPYRSIAKLGRDIYPFLPEGFSRFDLDTEKHLAANKQLPVLIVHGTNDEVIPYKHGSFLAKIGKNSSFVSVVGGRHNNLSDFPDTFKSVNMFLENISDSSSQN